jgi:hypothetical protein
MLAFFIGLSLNAIPVHSKDSAIVIPSNNWEAVKQLERGAEISVRMKFGDVTNGRFQELRDQEVRLLANDTERSFRRADFAEIRRLHVQDSRINGTLIGLGIGGATGGIAAVTVGKLMANEGKTAWPAAALAVGIGIGAMMGFTVDSAIKGGDRILCHALD